MKYIEELITGDVFLTNNNFYILTSDFKKNGSRMAVGLNNGLPIWFNSQETVEIQPIFTTDKDNNIIPITNVNNIPQDQDIHQIPSVAYSTRTT